MKWKTIIFGLALVWYGITAYFSSGYFHPDEHYQIVEFALALEHKNTPETLPWEYREQIRPTLQPVLAHAIFEVCYFFDLNSPYERSWVLRCLSALFALLVIYHFSSSAKFLVRKEYWLPFLLLSYFLWFLPFLNVRYSSETWSGLSFLMGISLLLRKNRKVSSIVLMGLFFGLSFLFRFQMAIGIVLALLWLIVVEKLLWQKTFYLIGVVFLLVGLGFLIDTEFYGNPVFTPWNYFQANVLEGKASSFGTSPWYFYLVQITTGALYPIGVLMILAFLYLAWKKPKFSLVWIILGFVAAHSAIPHKELRFLFPLINFAPFILVYFIQSISIKNWVGYALVASVLLLGLIPLLISSFSPAGAGRSAITQLISKPNYRGKVEVYYLNNSNPFSPWGAVTSFYTDTNLVFYNLEKIEEEKIHNHTAEPQQHLVVEQRDLENEKVQSFIDKLNLIEKGKSRPQWTIPWLDLYGYNTEDVLVLYSSNP